MLENREKSLEYAFLINRAGKAIEENEKNNGINTISKNELITEYLKNHR